MPEEVPDMEYQQKILLAVTALLVVFALYIALTSGPQRPADTTEAKDILMSAMLFGKGQESYTYSFSDSTNGYNTTYEIAKNSGGLSVSLQNPLSSKNAYFLQNDTILCVSYANQDACSSVMGNESVANYMESVKVNSFNDSTIDKNADDASYLIDRGYLQLDPAVTQETFSGHNCDQIDYTLDYSNITVDDAARFGIGVNAPRIFTRSICMDNQTGYVYDNTLNYSYNGIEYSSEFRLLSFNPGSAPQIIPPQNLSGDPIQLLIQERAQTINLATCFTDKTGDDRDKCVADMALSIKYKGLCDYAGARRDRCLVSLIPLTKDNETCDLISDQSYKDDCYIELAGAYKDAAFCSDVKNVSKTQECQDAAKVVVPPAENQTNALNTTSLPTNSSASPANSTALPSNSSVNQSYINSFMTHIDMIGENTTGNTTANSTAATNASH